MGPKNLQFGVSYPTGVTLCTVPGDEIWYGPQ